MRHTDQNLTMPPEKKLTDRQVADLTRWVAMGLPYPQDRTVSTEAPRPEDFWAFKPPADPPLPLVSNVA